MAFTTRFLTSFLLFHLLTVNDFVSGIESVLGVRTNISYINNSAEVVLKMDQAYVEMSPLDPVHEFLVVYGISENCYKCPLLRLHPVTSNRHALGFIMDTRWPFKLRVQDVTGNKSCSIKFHFGEGGYYTYEVKTDRYKLGCAMMVNVPPVNSFIPILVAAAIFLALALLVIFIKWLRRGYLRSIHISMYSDGRLDSDLGTANQTVNRTVVPPARKRLKSLDAFRGLSLMIMVFVNFGGGGYWFFKHSKWNGLTVADLVFPWFIFIMGVSLALSFQSLMKKKVRKISIFMKIVRRTLILFALGLLLNKGVDLHHYRIPGVLQRFAFSYFVVASLELFLHHRTDNAPQSVWWFIIREIIQLWKQWIVMFFLLAVYLILLYAVRAPGCPRGYVGPGGIGEGHPESENCTGGMAGYLDRILFGENHIYSHPTSEKLYHSKMSYDPEGALGAITSAFLTFLGLQAGKIIITHADDIEKERRLLTWALTLGLIALGLCGCSKNSGLIPINKNLWSLSFVLATGALAFVLLAFCYLTVDHNNWWNGTPFTFPGMNSILVYCGHEVLHSFFPFNWQLNPVTHSKQLAMNLWGVTAWVIIAYYCYKIDFFVKI